MFKNVERVEDIAEVFKSGKYVGDTIVLFYGTEQCPPCKMMKQWIATNVKKDVVLFIDVEQFPELAEKNNIQAVPMLFLYRYDRDEEGNYSVVEIATIKGYNVQKLQTYVM